jgi:hypothetical protein
LCLDNHIFFQSRRNGNTHRITINPYSREVVCGTGQSVTEEEIHHVFYPPCRVEVLAGPAIVFVEIQYNLGSGTGAGRTWIFSPPHASAVSLRLSIGFVATATARRGASPTSTSRPTRGRLPFSPPAGCWPSKPPVCGRRGRTEGEVRCGGSLPEFRVMITGSTNRFTAVGSEE